MQQNQVYVIQVNTKNKGGPLALPAPGDALLPSEVKYSASLVRGLGCTHLVLGAVLFLLGVLGSWVEPETCWAGAGIWSGIATIACGICGILAHHLWYKNYTIKAFLVTSVVSVVISILAIILTIYGLVNRYEHYYYLVERAEKQPWFRSYNQNKEQQLTLSVSANQLVGFFLEFFLASWSVKIGWKGVRAEEFSSSRRDAMCDDLQSVVSVPHHNGQQIPLAALYQLLQAHPELLGSKNINGSLGHPWISGLDDRPSHRSMDYQERVSRFLSNAIEDHNASFSRSPSVFQGEVRENSPTTRQSSVAGDCEDRGSPSGGSADTLVMYPDPGNEGSQSAAPSKDLTQKTASEGGVGQTDTMKSITQKIASEGGVGQTDTMKSITQIQATRQRPDGQLKGKAPNPKNTKQSISKEKVEGQKQENMEVHRTEHQIDSSRQMNTESNENAICEKLTKDSKKNIEQNSIEEKKEEALPQPEEQATAECNHQGSGKVLAEKNAEGETSNSMKNSKDTKKKSKEKKSSSKKMKEEDPSPPKIEEEERNHLETRAPPKIEEEERNPIETRDTSEDERKNSNEALTSNKTAKESKKKSKEKRRKSKERIEEEPSQGQEEQDKTQTKKSKEHKSHKEEKHKSSKKEVNTVNDEDNANETNEHKQNKNRLNETETKETAEITSVEIIENGTHSKVNSDIKSEHPNLIQNEKTKKSKKSKRDKTSTEKSKTQKEATASNTVLDDTPKDMSVQGQLIEIKPPSEFQDG